jgi:hypothetical protein
MPVLSKLTSLETLLLSNTNLTDDGVVQLKSLPHLRILWILNTAVSEGAITELKKALPDCHVRRFEDASR